MNILVTAGSTVVHIDQVRVISNIFRGKTGTAIARHCIDAGDSVTLVTSNPCLAKPFAKNLRVVPYKTYDDLAHIMENEVRSTTYDAIIHSAAVSDYAAAKVFAKEKGGKLVPLHASAKVSSSHESLYLELIPTAKLVDQIRKPWGFKGILVKFKLEVGISEERLLDIAKKSRTASDADFIVANNLEWATSHAFIIDRKNNTKKISRRMLAAEIRRRLM